MTLCLRLARAVVPSSSNLIACRFRQFSIQAENDATKPRTMEDTVTEQRQVLFPNAQKLEEAWQQKDMQRQAASNSSDWSPRQLPYKTYEKDSSPDDSDEDDVPKGTGEDGLEVGVDEVGFRYNGPEPTSFGDWAHKGRVTDFWREARLVSPVVSFRRPRQTERWQSAFGRKNMYCWRSPKDGNSAGPKSYRCF